MLSNYNISVPAAFRRKILHPPAWILVCTLLLVTSPLLLTAPGAYTSGWDLVGYIGTVLAHEHGDDMPAVHTRTYAEINNHAPAQLQRELSGETGYTRPYAVMAADVVAFTQQLPIYRARPAYPLLMYVLNACKLDLVTAALLISKLAFLGLGLLLYRWLSVYLRTWPACLVTLLTMMHMPVWALANRPTPDGLSALCVVAVLYLILERRALRTALTLACLSILVHPGNLLLLILCALVSTRQAALRTTALCGILAGTALYLVVDHSSGNYTWSVRFMHLLIDDLYYPADFTGTLQPHHLLEVYRALAPLGQVFDALWWWVITGLLMICARRYHAGAFDEWCRYLGAAVFMMVAIWVAAPFQTKIGAVILSPYYLLIVTGFASLLSTNPWVGTGRDIPRPKPIAGAGNLA